MHADKKERIKKVIKCMKDINNWNPNYTEISKKTGIPISSVYDIANKLMINKKIEVEAKFEMDIKFLEEL